MEGPLACRLTLFEVDSIPGKGMSDEMSVGEWPYQYAYPIPVPMPREHEMSTQNLFLSMPVIGAMAISDGVSSGMVV